MRLSILFVLLIGSWDPRCDLNNDGIVDSHDLAIFMDAWHTSKPTPTVTLIPSPTKTPTPTPIESEYPSLEEIQDYWHFESKIDEYNSLAYEIYLMPDGNAWIDSPVFGFTEIGTYEYDSSTGYFKITIFFTDYHSSTGQVTMVGYFEGNMFYEGDDKFLLKAGGYYSLIYSREGENLNEGGIFTGRNYRKPLAFASHRSADHR